MQDALGVLEGKALFGGPEGTVHVRVAEHDGAVYIDLANDRWEAVRVDSYGWSVIGEAPVMFRRAPGMLALPHPAAGVMSMRYSPS